MYVSACIKFAAVRLAEGSHMVKSRVNVEERCAKRRCAILRLSAQSVTPDKAGVQGRLSGRLNVPGRGLGGGTGQMLRGIVQGLSRIPQPNHLAILHNLPELQLVS